MNQEHKTILMIKPLLDDHWVSIERYYQDLNNSIQQGRSDFDIKYVDNLEKSFMNFDFIKRRWRYPQLIKNQVADIYHILDQSYANIVHFLRHKKTVITCHDLEFWRKRNILNYPMRAYILSGLKKASHIVCVSNTVKNELIDLAPELKNKTSVIYNFVNNKFIALNKDQKQILRKRKGVQDKILLLNVGSSALPRKNFDFTLEVLKSLPKEVSFQFVQIGARFTKEQKGKIKNFDLQDKIFQIPSATEAELLEWYQCANFFLMPSLYEGFGLPLIEGAACGVPLLFSDIPVFKELAGEDLEPLALNVHQWVQKILLLSSSGEQNEKLIQVQLQWVKKFKNSDWVEKYIQVYKALLS